MTIKKTEIEVNISCPKCKTQVLKAVASLSGVDQVTLDGEKGILTVIGEVDPVIVTKKVRKTGKSAKIVSVGPPKMIEPPPSNEVISKNYCPPPCGCELVAVSYISSYDQGFCIIL